VWRRTTSTFSCDIARAVSRSGGDDAERRAGSPLDAAHSPLRLDDRSPWWDRIGLHGSCPRPARREVVDDDHVEQDHHERPQRSCGEDPDLAAGVVAKQATIRWTRRESSLGMEGSIVNRARGAHRGIVRKALEVIHVAGLLAHSLQPAHHRREAVHLEPALMGAVDIAV
jgi:hypothetical protein